MNDTVSLLRHDPRGGESRVGLVEALLALLKGGPDREIEARPTAPLPESLGFQGECQGRYDRDVAADDEPALIHPPVFPLESCSDS